MPGKDWKDITASDYTYLIKPDSYKQRGQTCGIYALEAALKGQGVKMAPATFGELNLIMKILWKVFKLGGPVSLRAIAKMQQLTKVGELFSAEDVKTLGHQYKKDIGVVFFPGVQSFKGSLQGIIDAKRLIMIAFQPDNNGEPENGKGENAHWCCIFGYSKSPMDKVLAVHGWGGYYEFNIDKLVQSNSTLTTFAESRWYKYTGNDPKISRVMVLNNLTGPLYVEMKDIEKIVGAVYPDTSAEYKRELKNVREITLPEADLKLGLSHKLVII